jgi:Thioredoxin reductase
MHDILIIGGGPAGLTAAIYGCRAGLDVLLLEREMTGGKANYAYELENYPAEDGVSGTELAIKMRAQAEKYGAKILSDEAVFVDCANKSVETAYNGTLTAKNLIIATGTENRKLNVLKEETFVGKGVSYCAVCDGGFFRRKTVAVIGGGNTAFKDALYLCRFVEKVYLIHRREGFRAEKVLVERAKAEPKIEFVLNAVVTELLGKTRVEGIKLRFTSGDIRDLKIDGVS